jgi:hypothetical protein
MVFGCIECGDQLPLISEVRRCLIERHAVSIQHRCNTRELRGILRDLHRQRVRSCRRGRRGPGGSRRTRSRAPGRRAGSRAPGGRPGRCRHRFLSGARVRRLRGRTPRGTVAAGAAGGARRSISRDLLRLAMVGRCCRSRRLLATLGCCARLALRCNRSDADRRNRRRRGKESESFHCVSPPKTREPLQEQCLAREPAKDKPLRQLRRCSTTGHAAGTQNCEQTFEVGRTHAYADQTASPIRRETKQP